MYEYCRDIRPNSSLSIFILGLRPKPRIRDRPRWVNIIRGAHVSK